MRYHRVVGAVVVVLSCDTSPTLSLSSTNSRNLSFVTYHSQPPTQPPPAPLVPGDRIPGECESASECGFNVKCQDDPTRDCGFIQGGECQHGLCQCYQGFECSMCNAANVNGPEHCPDDYVKEGDTLECPPKPPRTGGAACESVDDCGPQDDGTFGGSCSDGKCKCWPGFTCPNCGRTRTEVDDGMQAWLWL